MPNANPSIASILAGMSQSDLNNVKSLINSMLNMNYSSTITEVVTKKKSKTGIFCPYCKSPEYRSNGNRYTVKDGKVPRYKCLKCGRTYTVKTNTITSSSKLDYDTLQIIFMCMLKGASISTTASIANVNKNTVWLWRHKILDALQTDKRFSNMKMNGVVEEGDEFYAISYKGNHETFKLPRPAHHHGGNCTEGKTKEDVCAPIAVSRDDNDALARVACRGTPTKTALMNFYGRSFFGKGVILVTAYRDAYKDYAKALGHSMIGLSSSRMHYRIYDVTKLEKHKHTLNDFMLEFNGVSTKYINNYLLWHVFKEYTDGSEDEKQQTFENSTLAANITVIRRKIRDRPPVPCK